MFVSQIREWHFFLIEGLRVPQIPGINKKSPNKRSKNNGTLCAEECRWCPGLLSPWWCLLLYPSRHSCTPILQQVHAALRASQRTWRASVSTWYRSLFLNTDQLVVLFSYKNLIINQNGDIRVSPGLTLGSARIVTWREGRGKNTFLSFLHRSETANSGERFIRIFPHLHTCLVYVDSML